VDQTKSALQW